MGSQIESKPPHVVVVGAGIIGATLGWHLTRDGANVTIIAEDVGGTATPCSFAWLNASWNNPRFYYDLRRRSMAGWKRLADEVPQLQQLMRWKGGLGWDLSPEKREAYLKEHTAWGYDIRRIERQEIQSLEPLLRPDGDFLPEWGIRTGEEGSVEAADAARLLVAEAQSKGATLVTSTVADLLLLSQDDVDGGSSNSSGNKTTQIIKGVKTATGEVIEADHVVLAAGMGCVALAASVGLTVPVSSPPGLLIHTKPVGERLLNSVIYAQGLHMRQAPDGRILSGSDFAGGDPGADPVAAANELLTKLKAAFKPSAAVEGLELDHFTVGYRPVPKDGLPILGATGADGLSIAVMHSGVTNAAIVGELLSATILTGKEDPALANFALKRFSKAESS